MKQRKLQVGVIGGREANPEILEAARQVGFLIAQKGAVLICGGLGGVMSAACEGAKEAFGLTVGIPPDGAGGYGQSVRGYRHTDRSGHSAERGGRQCL